MYFRKIEGESLEFYATNSSGNFAALTRKTGSSANSWAVFTGPEDGEPEASNLNLEEAIDFIILNYSLVAEQKQRGGKRAKKRTPSE